MFPKDVRRLRLARIVIDLSVRAVAILSDNVRRMACARDPHLRRFPLSVRSEGLLDAMGPRHRANSDHCLRGARFAVPPLPRLPLGFTPFPPPRTDAVA